MPDTTAEDLERTARIIHLRGLHRGNQFARHGRLDICAAIYVAAEAGPVPAEFFTDEDVSLALIGASARAMAAIRTLSQALDSEPCETEIAPGYTVPDYIEHVSNWAATPPIGEKFPPTTAEVIGRLLRASDQATPKAA
jgi:hypothetical protein